jgi:DNA processing protein
MATTARMAKDEELYWMALHLAPGLGPRKAQSLLETFRSPQAIFQAPRSELEAAGLPPGLAQSLASGCVFEEAATQQAKMLQEGVQLIPVGHAAYSGRLREIFDPPVALFVKGRTELLNAVGIAVVGTRRPSAYGMAAAERISRELAEAGVCIVSGMARGIDTKAHGAALDAGGDTIAVFGCGIDVIYPAENRKLAERIADKGLLVSEFAMGAPGYPQNFPVRNRIVSGLSAGVMVVEGAQYSGSSITAKLAADQGREVFAIPGNITSKMSWAPNLLIKQGAKLVQEWNDVVSELAERDRMALAAKLRQKLLELGDPTPQPSKNEEVIEAADPNAAIKRALLNTLPFDKPSHLDHLMEVLVGYSASEIIAALFELELLGLVRQLPGKNFIKVWLD